MKRAVRRIAFAGNQVELSVVDNVGLLVEYIDGTGGAMIMQGDGERIWNMWFGGMPIEETDVLERLKLYEDDTLSWNVQDHTIATKWLTNFISEMPYCPFQNIEKTKKELLAVLSASEVDKEMQQFQQRYGLQVYCTEECNIPEWITNGAKKELYRSPMVNGGLYFQIIEVGGDTVLFVREESGIYLLSQR